MTDIPRWQKYAAGATLAGGLLIGGEAIQQHESPEFAQWGDTAQAFGALAALALGAAAVLREGAPAALKFAAKSEVNRNLHDLQGLTDHLPKLRADVTLDSIYDGLVTVANIDEYFRDNAHLTMMKKHAAQTMAITRLQRPGTLVNTLPPQLDAYQAIDEIAESLISERRTSLNTLDRDAYQSNAVTLINACQVLDVIAPIDEDCIRTPQTGAAGKYWIDFIEQEVRTRQQQMREQRGTLEGMPSGWYAPGAMYADEIPRPGLSEVRLIRDNPQLAEGLSFEDFIKPSET